MMLKLQIVLLLTASLLEGCGNVAVFGHTIGEGRTSSEAKTDSTPAAQDAAIPGARAVKAVTLVLTPQVAAKVADDSTFKKDALLDAIKAELRSRQLFDDTDSRATATAEISLDDFAVRPTSNAVVLGYIINDGTLSGELRVRDGDGKDLQRDRIEAKSKVTAAANRENPDFLVPLYRRFASVTGDWLAGTPSKPDTVQNPLGR
jgi:hypothetical protein